MLNLIIEGGDIVSEQNDPSSLQESSVSLKLVELIERNADELTRHYIEDAKRSLRLPTYGKFDEKKLYKRVFGVYSQLGKWISLETSREEVRKYWTDLGRTRREEGFPLAEVILSLTMLRRHLWMKVRSEGLLDTAPRSLPGHGTQ